MSYIHCLVMRHALLMYDLQKPLKNDFHYYLPVEASKSTLWCFSHVMRIKKELVRFSELNLALEGEERRERQSTSIRCYNERKKIMTSSTNSAVDC